jgi:DNA-binding NarL/FixJ family response regulator
MYYAEPAEVDRMARQLNPTARQVQIVELASMGLRQKEIAYHLGISRETVKSMLGGGAQVDGLYRRLGVNSMVAAYRELLRRGYLQPPGREDE